LIFWNDEIPVPKLEKRVQPYRRGKAGSGGARGSAEWVRIPTSRVRPRKFTTAQLTFITHYHVQISSLARVGQGQQLKLLSWASQVFRSKQHSVGYHLEDGVQRVLALQWL
jgi:hypothetical protein